MAGYQDLVVWRKSVDLVVAVYTATDSFPKSEIYGLTSQIRRCAVSIPSNIAEGSKRGTKKDFKHFLSMALGSVAELETQIILTHRLSLLPELSFISLQEKTTEVSKMLTTLIRSDKLHTNFSSI